MRFNAYYTDDGRSFGRDLVSLEKRPAPAMQPKKIEFAGQYEKKVRFSFSIEFSEKGVTVEGDMKDPPVIKYPTVFAYAAYFTASHQIPPATPPEEVRQLTEKVRRELQPYAVRPVPHLVDEEAYTVFCIQAPLTTEERLPINAGKLNYRARLMLS